MIKSSKVLGAQHGNLHNNDATVARRCAASAVSSLELILHIYHNPD